MVSCNGYFTVKKALVLVVLLIAVFVGELLLFDNNTRSENKTPLISVTSYPLYEITHKLIGSKIEVDKLIPYGVETHTYMPSVKTMSSIFKADLFIYNGLGIEPWIKQDYENALDMSKHVKLNENHECHEHEEGHHHDEDADPHYWLDLNNMIRMTKVIQERLNNDFPENKTLVDANAHEYINELKALESSFESRLKVCKRDEIVVNHNAFGYIASNYDFQVHSVTGLSPDEQVSAKKMKEITDLVKDENIKVIFFESFVSSKVAQTISKETGARVESLQPLANVTEAEADQGYILIMQENLEKLSTALECK